MMAEIRSCYCGMKVELRRQGTTSSGDPWGWAIYCPRCEIGWLTARDDMESLISAWGGEKRQPWCCVDWQMAQQDGTDNEGYGAFLSWYPQDDPPYWKGGCDLAPINFCPWCGLKKP